ncbi:mRNA interferase [Candidatus Magnetomoraceae bacterium gMMP-15]
MNNGEIWLINLNPTIGSEIRKTRPAIIVNSDDIGILPLKVIVPITDWKSHYGKIIWMVHIQPNIENNLAKESGADVFQVRSVSEKRFVKKIGKVSKMIMEQIKFALKTVFEID